MRMRRSMPQAATCSKHWTCRCGSSSLLGRPVAVGTLDLETRPSELIRRLLEAVEPEPATHGTRPFVVLFPATAGDDVSTS